MLSALDKKLFRDLAHIWAQALAIALVIAGGVATFILGIGAQRSLAETRQAYYERYQFADIFGGLSRAPNYLAAQIAEIPGVAIVQTRIVKTALLDIEGMVEPATAAVISLPDHKTQKLNRLYLRSGRLPEPRSRTQIVISEGFATAHKFTVGSTLKVNLNGRKRKLDVVGIALSPEYIYALGPGDLIPDDKRFGILWMSEKALSASYNLDGMFNSITLKLQRNATSADVVARVDQKLARYGGLGAFTRKDQQSHAFLDAELKQLAAMSKILPPIFLLVSAFLINMTLTRLIDLEREQIGLLKALGYARTAIAVHYLKMTFIIASIGVIIGFAAGAWLGHGLTVLYGEFYRFPFLIFLNTLDLYALAALITLGAALIGGMRSVLKATMLAPAVAMSPPAPTQYRRFWGRLDRFMPRSSQVTTMVFRHIFRWPVRAAMSALGVALAIAILITSLFTLDSVEFMIDTTFFRTDRQDATISFTDEQPLRALQNVMHLPGILVAEPFRAVPVKISHGHIERRIAIMGKPLGMDLSRILNLKMATVSLPEKGITLSEKLAELLDVKRGELVRIKTLEGRRRVVNVPVTEIVQGYLGLQAFMQISALHAMMDEGHMISGAYVSIDMAKQEPFFQTIKNTPRIKSVALQKASLAKFRDTIAENITIMTLVYTVLGVLIAFGVVYNSARIQLSERGREFASLRVLGFTKAEVSKVLLSELAVLVAIAIPFGWVLGAMAAWATIQGFDNELYRIPFIIENATYARAALVIIGAALVSALIVRRRIDKLDLIEVLKARE